MLAIIRCRTFCLQVCYHKNIKIYRTLILPAVLYGCETWSLTLKEERRLRVFENRLLRGIFGPKRDGVTGEWRKLLITKHYSGDKIEGNEVVGACSTRGRDERCIQGFDGVI